MRRLFLLLVPLAACSKFAAAEKPSRNDEDAAASGPPVEPPPLPLDAGEAGSTPNDCPVDASLYCETFTKYSELGALDGLTLRGGAGAELVGTPGAADRALRFTADVWGQSRSGTLTARLGSLHTGPIRISFRMKMEHAAFANLVFLSFTTAEQTWQTTYNVYVWAKEARLGLGEYMEEPSILNFKRAPGTFDVRREQRVAFTVDLAKKTVSASLDGTTVVTLPLTPPDGRDSMWIATGVQTHGWDGPAADVTYDDVVVEAL